MQQVSPQIKTRNGSQGSHQRVSLVPKDESLSEN